MVSQLSTTFDIGLITQFSKSGDQNNKIILYLIIHCYFEFISESNSGYLQQKN